MLYLDHSATTRPLDEVVEAVSEVMKSHYGNPSSLHRIGMEAEQLVNRARSVIAHVLSVEPEQIIFTSGGTESNNLAIRGAAYAFRSRGNHLITSETEHPSVYECFRRLEREGFRVTYLPVDRTGGVSVDDLERALEPSTILVSIMHVNNETGRVQPIEPIGTVLKQYPRIVFHVDAIQSVGKLPIMPNEWGIDLMSLSAHKLRGPKGIGLLVRRRGLTLEPLMVGGGQEAGLRPGTENVPLIVGMAKAIRIAGDNREEHARHMHSLRMRMLDKLHSLPITINTPYDRDEAAPHIVHFSLPGIRSEVALHALEERGMFVSTRSACSSGNNEPSRVLLAMGMDEEAARSGIRVSLGPELSFDDIDQFVHDLKQIIQHFRP